MRGWAVVVLVLLIAACDPAEGQARPIPPYAQSAELCGKPAADVPALPARQSTVVVPAGVQVAWVLDCAEGIPSPDGKRQNNVRRADGPATELLAALRLPSATEPADACTDEYLLPIYLALITADGRAIAPAIPVDGCGKPRREVLNALGRLAFR